MKKDIINVVKVAIIGLALTAGTNYLFAAWSAPAATPPNGNVDAPINVSASGQTKTGNLIIQALDSAGNALQNGLIVSNGRVGIDTVNPGYALEVNGATKVGSLIVADGTQGSGKILTDVNGSGTATWQTPSSGVTMVLYNAPITLFSNTSGHAFSTTTGTIIAGTTSGISSSAKAVLLYGHIDDGNTVNAKSVQFKQPSQTTWKYLVNAHNAFYPSNNSTWVPLDSNKQLNWSISGGSQPQDYTIEVQGEMD